MEANRKYRLRNNLMPTVELLDSPDGVKKLQKQISRTVATAMDSYVHHYGVQGLDDVRITTDINFAEDPWIVELNVLLEGDWK